jgi:hypothetical protein
VISDLGFGYGRPCGILVSPFILIQVEVPNGWCRLVVCIVVRCEVMPSSVLDLTLLMRSCLTNAGLVTIVWINGTTKSTDDRVAFWQLGTSPPTTTFVSTSWAYTYGGQDALPSGVGASRVSGSVNITSPATAGTYTVYYCPNSGYSCIASCQVTVVGECGRS